MTWPVRVRDDVAGSPLGDAQRTTNGRGLRGQAPHAMRDQLPEETLPATVLVTGSAGFISGYLVQELLDRGHKVLGVDNFSKYGPVTRNYSHHPNYSFVEGDAKDVALLTRLVDGCDQLVASAARIGGISYFHEFAYDLMAENERNTAAHFDEALAGFQRGTLVGLSGEPR